MAENKNKIIVYRDWISTFEQLSDDEAGRLIKHFFRYINDLDPISPDRITTLLFEPIKQTLKRDLQKYVQVCNNNRVNASMRWKKENATACDRINLDAKHADSDNDNDNDNDNDSDSDSDNDNDSGRFKKPSILEIQNFLDEKNITSINAETFYSFYESKGWMIGKNKMKNWKSAVITWKNKEKNSAKKESINYATGSSYE